jgi:nitrite reductase (NADH) large subunit
VPCEMFLAATGIRPNIDLARDAGIPVNKGVLVDDRMQTRVPGVFAAGDVAEHGGHVRGLWPVATEQAQAAVVNALGGDMILTCQTPPTILKGVDLDLFSVGAVEPTPSDEVIVVDRPAATKRWVPLSGRSYGRATGACWPTRPVRCHGMSESTHRHECSIPARVSLAWGQFRSSSWRPARR